ncbi:PLP-dependent aminotransferase family protein, partial [Acinetobacter baumannii]|nr:PLP-dependent aminotransferase family protein [Acinetobacter baumannii]
QNRAPKLIYLTPAHQYPTGAVLSVSRRLSLITQAARKDAWLIEDDYDGDFRHSGGPIASMQGLTEDAPVFYIGSFSKTMFPSLKLGYVVFPANVMKQASTVLN